MRQCEWEAAVVPVRLLITSTLLLHQSIRWGEDSATILANWAEAALPGIAEDGVAVMLNQQHAAN